MEEQMQRTGMGPPHTDPVPIVAVTRQPQIG